MIEGIDGAGKTTQAELVSACLDAIGIPVVRSKEPTDGPWGQRIRQSASTGRLAPSEELEAFIEDRKEHVAKTILPALELGKVVVVDRYYFSSAAYQGARGMDPEYILRENEKFAPQPDLLVILEVDAATGVRRVTNRGDVGNLFEREEDLQKSAKIFSELQRPYLYRIDGTRTREEITRDIITKLADGPLFQQLCNKSHYKDSCEPELCTFRISNTCNYIKLLRSQPPIPRG